ncbi:organic cation transporter protein-like isoform X3 [Tachypleus tridentatus]|uniref:organic cation transporter protein-like isoform X3 n=1 Tax=Tachypleus tridentatus TaxID=6853 RepID=UPI003FD25C36
MSEEEWKNFSVPVVAQETGQQSFSKCWMYDVMNNTNLNNTREVHYCFEWEYDHTQYKSSIVEQWNLVCNNSWMISLSQMFYMSGYLVSSFITGQLSDRFFVALGVTGVVTSSFVLLMEIVDQSQRSTLGIAFQMGWGVSSLILSVLAWFIRDWTYLQLSISVPMLALAGHWWLLPESPRFLLSHRRFQEAEHELKKALITNGKDPSNLPSIMSKLVANVENENSTYKEKTVLDLLKVPKWRKKSLAMFSIWFAISFIYFGLSFNTNNLGGDPFLNFLIAAAVEFPSYFGTIFVVKRLGKKFPLVISVIIAGVALLLIIPVPYELVWLKVTISMAGKLAITASFTIVYVYSAEIFPTVVRNIGVGTSSACARLGSMLAPFVKELGTAVHPDVPYGLFGALCLLAGCLILTLPETHNKPIADTLQEENSID